MLMESVMMLVIGSVLKPVMGSVNFSHHSQNLLFGVKTSSQATKLCQSETLADKNYSLTAVKCRNISKLKMYFDANPHILQFYENLKCHFWQCFC